MSFGCAREHERAMVAGAEAGVAARRKKVLGEALDEFLVRHCLIEPGLFTEEAGFMIALDRFLRFRGDRTGADAVSSYDYETVTCLLSERGVKHDSDYVHNRQGVVSSYYIGVRLSSMP